MKYLLLILLIIMTGCTTKIVGPEPDSCEWVEKFNGYTYIPFPGNTGTREPGFESFGSCEDFSRVGLTADRVHGYCEAQFLWVCE